MNEDFLNEINDFFGRAAVATYAGSGPRVAAERGGFQELAFEDGDWSYRDSYTGYIRSRGQEIIRYRGDPVWAQSYGGGMEGRFARDRDLSDRNMAFLKTALSSGDKRTRFQPRGPHELVRGDWRYAAEWAGDIAEFRGTEEIHHRGELVFTHQFIGGLIEP